MTQVITKRGRLVDYKNQGYKKYKKYKKVLLKLSKIKSSFFHHHRRQYENSNGEREDIKPPVKRHTEEFTYYSYGDSNTTGSFHDDMDDDQDDGFADVGGMEEQAQILGQQLENETTPEDVDVHYLNCDKPAVCSELQPDIKPPFEIQADGTLNHNN